MTVLKGMGRMVNSYFSFGIEFKKDFSSSMSSYFLPVALRSLMEASSVALLTRLDPLRVVHSSKSQSNEKYDKSRPQASAIKWKGDVIEEGNASLWDSAVSSQKLPRSLLSATACEAVWVPAHRNAVQWIEKSGLNDSVWLHAVEKQNSEDFRKIFVGEGSQLYSELSKGIHPEFAVRRESEFDAETLSSLLERTSKWVSQISFLSHFAPGLSFSMDREAVYNSVLEVERTVNG
ncbi:hypothetical protein U2S91_23030 [Stenotrophomonas maltophilia]|nr:hypothetical protein [Stenotrophomonas maltophilia]WQI20976.1 hypothetical protein U2S91_23030 [Stenotrophomonas maltophilia]